MRIDDGEIAWVAPRFYRSAIVRISAPGDSCRESRNPFPIAFCEQMIPIFGDLLEPRKTKEPVC
jgi:hypothetical protein